MTYQSRRIRKDDLGGKGVLWSKTLRRIELNKAKQVIIGHVETMTHNSTLPEGWNSSVM